MRFLSIISTVKNVSRAMSSPVMSQTQATSLNEQCILVNAKDEALGSASKRDCHTVGPDGHIPLHRAFSVFIFNKKKELLVQKRSYDKITYPGHVTNACCSHPLHEIPPEREEKNALGIKTAARRRLHFELGIPLESINIDDMVYLTRIIYKDLGDGVWGEHEVDYIIFMVGQDLPLKPYPEEVCKVEYLARDKFEKYLADVKDPVTPWFALIAKHRLLTWWDNLDRLAKFQDHSTITDFR